MLKLKLTITNFFVRKKQKYNYQKMFETRGRNSILATILGLTFKTLVLCFFGLIILFPFYFMFALALLTNEQTLDGTFHWYAPDVFWENFRKAFESGYWEAIGVTAAVTTISVIARTFFSMTVGYAFSFKKWRFKTAFWWFLLSLLMLPEVALMLGQFKVITDLGWKVNSWIIVSMFLPFMSSTFSAFMYRNAFLTIPDRTKEAAMIDGVGPLKFFFTVAMPMVKSTTLTVIILTAFASWNSFTWPELLLSGNTDPGRYDVVSTWLFKVGIDSADADNTRIYTNIRMAGAILTIAPMFLAYLVFRKKIMKAISGQGTAIKG